MIRWAAPLVLLSALGCSQAGSPPRTPSAVPETDVERLRLRNYPNNLMLLGYFLRMRHSAIPEEFVTVVCDARLGVTDEWVQMARERRWADSIVREQQCGALPRPTGAYRTIVHLDSIVIGRESSYVQARSLRGWDGEGAIPFREWLTERLVWRHVQIPGEFFFTVSGWNLSRDVPR